MKNIIISVSEHIAAAAEDYSLGCGNVYTITFEFDSEWSKQEVKTVRFIYSQFGVRRVINKVITGNTCETPIFSNTKSVEIGVFAGNLQTTTPCVLKLEKSILCGDGIPEAPEDNTYSEIVSLCSEALNTAKSVEERANNGEFNGKPGLDGAPGKDGTNGDDYILTKYDKEEIALLVVPNVDSETSKKISELDKRITAQDIFEVLAKGSVVLKNNYNSCGDNDFTAILGHKNNILAIAGFSAGAFNVAHERSEKKDQDSPILLGQRNESYNVFNVGLGRENIIYSPFGVAMGYKCKAGNEEAKENLNMWSLSNFICAFAQGWEAHAKHSFSTVFGCFTRSSAPNQVVFGKYNADNPNAFLIIGCGTSENDRRNALEITSESIIIDGKPHSYDDFSLEANFQHFGEENIRIKQSIEDCKSDIDSLYTNEQIDKMFGDLVNIYAAQSIVENQIFTAKSDLEGQIGFLQVQISELRNEIAALKGGSE